jgi:hypothetical protein
VYGLYRFRGCHSFYRFHEFRRFRDFLFGYRFGYRRWLKNLRWWL